VTDGPRPDWILHNIPVSEWTEEEARLHLKRTFEIACRQFSDIMEPWIVRLDDTADFDEQIKLMRMALAKTLTERWP
jgi:hypothetical protein